MGIAYGAWCLVATCRANHHVQHAINAINTHCWIVLAAWQSQRGKEAKRQRGKEARRQRGKESKRQRSNEARRQRSKEAKRQRSKEAKNTIPCHIIPCHTIPFHTIPYHTIPSCSADLCIVSHLVLVQLKPEEAVNES